MIILAALAAAALLIPTIVTGVAAAGKMKHVQDAPVSKVAIVFGAGLQRDGRPTLVLRDRVAAAADLYFAGKVEKILMSGDNRFVDYNEPGAMQQYAIELGVPVENIIMDFAGRRTYDTCYRAKAIFGVTEALLVTQKFHLPRAIFTCNALGVQSSGVIADRRDYHSYSLMAWSLRELPARLIALVDVWIRHPLPVLGPFEPID
jgi:SanA protein